MKLEEQNRVLLAKIEDHKKRIFELEKELKNFKIESGDENQNLQSEQLLDSNRDEDQQDKYQLHNRLDQYSMDLISRISMDGLYLYTSPSHQRITGYNPEDLIGSSAFQGVHPDDRQFIIDNHYNNRKSKEVRKLEFRIRCKNGSYIWIEAIINPVVNSKNQVEELIVSSRDITTRKSIEETLKESENRYRNLIENSLDGVFIHKDGKLLFVNQAYCSIRGYKKEELLGTSIWNFLPDNKFEQVHQSISNMAKEKISSQQITYPIQTGSGEEKVVNIIVRATLYNNEKVMIGIMRDVTDLKKGEKALVKQRDLVLKLNASGNIEEALRILLAHALDNQEIDAGGIYLVDQDSGDLHLKAHANLSQDFVKSVSCFPQESENTKLIYKKQPIYLPIRQIPINEYDLFLNQNRYLGFIVLPIVFRDHVVGCMNLISKTAEIPTEETRRVLEIIIAQVGAMFNRMQAEELVRENELKLRSFIQQSSDGIILTNGNGKISMWNAGMEHITRLPTEDVVGKFIWEIQNIFSTEEEKNNENHEIALEKIWKDTFINEMAESDEQKFREHEISLGIDQKRVLEEKTFVVKTERGMQVGSIIRDVTETRNMVKQILHSQREWEATFNAIDDLIFLADDTGIIISANQSARNKLGMLKGELTGLKMDQLLYGDEKQPISLKGFDGELQFPKINGWFEMASYPVTLSGGDWYVYVIKDVTARKEVEHKLITSQKMADLGTLAAGVAHEVNSPLQVITGLSERMLKNFDSGTTDDPRNPKYIQTIHNSAWKVVEIIRSLLTYARPSAGEIQTHNLNTIIEDTLLIIAHQLTLMDNLKIEMDLNPNLPDFNCDANKISQVLINLLFNARDSMQSGGVISVRTDYERTKDRVILEVADTGKGIPQGIQNKIFDPFFTTKLIGDGTGLGLSIVQGIVKVHQGEIFLESKPNQGSQFKICFPRGLSRIDGNGLPGSKEMNGRFDD
ncbi:MAG: PAS domain S-box protein [Anaerolineaceae bacterium]|nr:PAS domain S-box protein [Anaerolineaceae bacterium]